MAYWENQDGVFIYPKRGDADVLTLTGSAETLDGVLQALELHGASLDPVEGARLLEGHSGPSTAAERASRLYTADNRRDMSLDLSRADVARWLEFEVMNYL